MDPEQEKAELKALEALYLTYADEFEALERERDHIVYDFATELDKEKANELKAEIVN